MRLSNPTILLAVLALRVPGLAPQKQVLITYPSDTPESALHEAKSSIEGTVSLTVHLTSFQLTILAKGGKILHEFGKQA